MADVYGMAASAPTCNLGFLRDVSPENFFVINNRDRDIFARPSHNSH
jgi:hypothetical protein